MEKKLYFAPESEVILIKTSGMLAGSPLDEGGGEATDHGDLNPGDEYVDPDL